ncbi:MAG: SMC-Scp complex subunit ScpB [Pseudomonadota bacterium]
MTGSRGSRKAKPAAKAVFDRELADLPQELRWREWMGRVEAVLFASASPVKPKELKHLVGAEVSLGILIGDIQEEISKRPYEIIELDGAWLLRTRARFAEAIRAAADLEAKAVDLNAHEMAVLCAIAYHQPVDRSQLADIFGKEVSRDLLTRLRNQNMIARGPRSPRPGAPHTFVTTESFLATFDLQSLRDLPDLDLNS